MEVVQSQENLVGWKEEREGVGEGRREGVRDEGGERRGRDEGVHPDLITTEATGDKSIMSACPSCWGQ